jgi:hypothetical protein
MAVATPVNAGVAGVNAGVEADHPRGWTGVTRRKCFRILIDVWGWDGIAVIADIARDRRNRRGRMVNGNGAIPGIWKMKDP